MANKFSWFDNNIIPSVNNSSLRRGKRSRNIQGTVSNGWTE
jgi:hypothetical protein